MERPPYASIVAHYEACLARHGDTHRGVDWPDAADAETRYRVMLDLLRRAPGERVELLDLGCGAAHLYEYMLRHPRYEGIDYSGLDLSEQFVALARSKFPERTFHHLDILQAADDKAADDLPTSDYVVLNGVLTERLELSQEEMLSYAESLLARAFGMARVGIAFNVMSKQVDWERADLFHVSFDTMADMVARRLSRNFVFRHDYGLYEYTVYVYH